MAYIDSIPPDRAEGQLADLYRRYANPDGSVDNILQLHSVNPAALAVHCGLYVQAMMQSSPLSKVEREMAAVTVSRVNQCHY